MKSLLAASLVVLLLRGAIASRMQQPDYPKGKYEAQADSLRKENLTPRREDSVKKSQEDKMPVLKSDTNKNTKMPVMEPERDQHMPVKELSDTLNKK